MNEKRATWKQQQKPSSLRALAEQLEAIRSALLMESEKAAEKAETVAREVLKRRG